MSGNSQVILSIVAGEILKPGCEIEVRTTEPVSPRSARSSVLLRQNGKTVPTPFRISEKGDSIKIPTKNIEPGNVELHLHELFDQQGKELVNHRITPFRIADLKGKIPDHVRIEHATNIAIGENGFRRLELGDKAPDGLMYVQFIKGVHRESGSPQELAFNEKGEEVNGQELLAAARKQRFAKFGILHPDLFDQVAKANGDSHIEVAVWPKPKVDLTGYEKPTIGEIKEIPAAAKKLLKEAADIKAALLSELRNLGAKIQESPETAPFILATLTPSQIHKLAEIEGIGKVFKNSQTGQDDLVDSEAVARATQAHALGPTGAGVNVAVFEAGPDNESNLSIAGKYLASPQPSTHARLTHAIIKNIEPGKPHGYAPDCQLYSANSYSNDALQWAVAFPQSCTVISQSFHRTLENDGPGQNEEFSDQFSLDDHFKDYIAVQWPYPTIVHAAGNGADTEYVNHKGYNTISVGNHDDFATAMDPSTIFTNPASPHGDRELPEIAANGTSVTAVGVTNSGTSFAAPAVAGTVALIQSVDGTLKSWPEACRAILFASADRTTVSGSTWVADLGQRIDQSDGAGALNAQMAVLIAQQRKFRDDPPAPRGFDLGSLQNTDFNIPGDRQSIFKYSIQVPQRGLIGLPYIYTVKVALAWDSKVTTDASGVHLSALTVDHDLFVFDSAGVQVAASASWDNSYEIVEFQANEGAVYDIRIRRFSGEDLVWFGLAWNVTSRLAFTFPGIDS